MPVLYILVSVACLAVGGYLILTQLKVMGKAREEGDKGLDVKGLIIGAIFVIVGIALFAI